MDNTISACQIWHTLLMSLHNAIFHLRCQGCQTYQNHNFFIIGSWLQLSILEWWSLLVEAAAHRIWRSANVCMAIMHAWEVWLIDCSCMHRYIVPLIHTGNPHKTSRCLVAHAHTERKKVIMTWKHQKYMKKSALKQCPLYKTLHNLCSTNVHHYNTKPRRYVTFIASGSPESSKH